MSAKDSAVVLDDRQRGVKVVATGYGLVYAHGSAGSGRLHGAVGTIRVLLKLEELYTSLCLWRKRRRARELMPVSVSSGAG